MNNWLQDNYSKNLKVFSFSVYTNIENCIFTIKSDVPFVFVKTVIKKNVYCKSNSNSSFFGTRKVSVTNVLHCWSDLAALLWTFCIQTSFKTVVSENGKPCLKKTSEQQQKKLCLPVIIWHKTFIESSCTNNLHAGEFFFLFFFFVFSNPEGFLAVSLQTEKKSCIKCISREGKTNAWCLKEYGYLEKY